MKKEKTQDSIIPKFKKVFYTYIVYVVPIIVLAAFLETYAAELLFTMFR